MISAFVEQLEADFLRFSPATPLKVFFDKKSIIDGQYWQNELRKGLRQSKVMIAFLSENYFRSEWCRKEWEEYILVEQSRTYPGEALTPIFIVPSDLATLVPPSARDWWENVTSRNAIIEIQPYWNQGRAALQEEIVAQRLLVLEQSIREQVEHSRILSRVPRDIRTRNPNFVGRRKELAALRDARVCPRSLATLHLGQSGDWPVQVPLAAVLQGGQGGGRFGGGHVPAAAPALETAGPGLAAGLRQVHSPPA